MLPEHFRITIPSEPSAGQQVQDRIIGALEARAFPPRDVFGVRLALEEAIVNAIKHGNGLDPNKSVHVECEVDDNRVRIVVRDEGPGFDPRSVPDPTDLENLDKPSGRGLMLMRAFMTRIEYNATGNEVTLEKVREGNGES
jgi:serine/threonine-protein kinase RsbW